MSSSGTAGQTTERSAHRKAVGLAVAAAATGLALLWAPTVPAILLSAYIAYLRRQERRRFVYAMDRRQAEAAAQRLRERRPRRRPVADEADPDEE